MEVVEEEAMEEIGIEIQSPVPQDIEKEEEEFSAVVEVDLSLGVDGSIPSTSRPTGSTLNNVVPSSSCKRNLFEGVSYWQEHESKDKNPKSKKQIQKPPSVISSEKWKAHFQRKEEEKFKKEEEKRIKRELREAKKESRLNVKTPKNSGEDWICTKCKMSYNEEKSERIHNKWIECDNCKRTFHFKCIPKNYLNSWDITEKDLDKGIIDFQCHVCIEEDC